MSKALEHFEFELSKIRAGRASASMLDGIEVNAYGVMTPLYQVGNISTPDARTISIQPWDASVLPEVEKAILKANVGITPQNDGKIIRLNVPSLTEERRKDLVKQAKVEYHCARYVRRLTKRRRNYKRTACPKIFSNVAKRIFKISPMIFQQKSINTSK